MKKKTMWLTIAGAMILLSACRDDKEVIDERISIESSIQESFVNVVQEEEKFEEEKEVNKNIYLPCPGKYDLLGVEYLIKDGWLYFMADIDGEETIRWFAYDISANKIVNKNGTEWNKDEWTLSAQTKIIEKADKDGWLSYWGASLIDLITGEEIVALNDNQIFVGDWIDGKIMVLEAIESFKGNKYSMGVMNCKGEWVYPLSSEYPWLDDSMKKETITDILEMAKDCGDGMLHIRSTEKSIYDIKNNQFRVLPENISCAKSGAHNGYVYCWGQDSLNLYSYNIYSQKLVDLWKEGTWDYEIYEGGWTTKQFQNAVHVKSIEGDLVAEYDMSSYHGWDELCATKDRLLFTCFNDSNTKYLCLMNADGSMEFEPQKWEDIRDAHYNIYMDDNKLIMYGPKQCFIYDMDTKHMINQRTDYTIREYLYESDMLLVSIENQEDGDRTLFYLVDICDFDKLINPFEVAYLQGMYEPIFFETEKEVSNYTSDLNGHQYYYPIDVLWDDTSGGYDDAVMLVQWDNIFDEPVEFEVTGPNGQVGWRDAEYSIAGHYVIRFGKTQGDTYHIKGGTNERMINCIIDVMEWDTYMDLYHYVDAHDGEVPDYIHNRPAEDED